MLNRMRMVVLAVGVMSFFVPMVVFSEPPPAGVNDVLIEMGKFEASYPARKWAEAATSVQAMEKKIKEIFVQAQRDDFILEEALNELQKNVTSLNATKVDVVYEPFQKQYFNYLSHFDHDVHPILIKIEQHVMKGAPAAYAAKDYDRVLQEMQTAAMLIAHGKAVLIKKDIPEQEINVFVSKVQALNLAGQADDYATMGEGLSKLQETYSIFMNKYKK